MEGCWKITPGFLEGYKCGQDEFPQMHAVLEKDGVKRWVEIEIGGGRLDLDRSPNEKSVEGRFEANKLSTTRVNGYPAPVELFRSGLFKVEGHEDGYFGVRSFSYGTNDVVYGKTVQRHQMPCLLMGDYWEKSPDGKTYIHPKDWLFEDVFDEVVRSMRCEVVDPKYVREWGEKFFKPQQQPNGKSVPAKKKPKKK